MTGKALTDNLNQAAAEKVAAIWQDARAEAQRRESEARRASEEARERAEQEAAARAQQYLQTATTRAAQEARRIRTLANAALAERLYNLARQALPQFRRGDSDALFIALAEELPPRRWQRVRVNPADERLARHCFAGAEVVADEAVAGGMEVAQEAGRIRIDNTLDARLRRAWPEILSRLVAGILREFSDHQPAA